MPKPPTRSDSTGTDTTSETMVGVTTAEIESLVKGACQKAMEVLKTELLNMFSDINTRLQTIEQRLQTMEQKVGDHDSALNDVSGRVWNIQHTVDDIAGNRDDAHVRIQESLQQLEAIRTEARNAMCMANDVEQYGRRNNIRIRGLKLRHGEECQTAVAMFFNENLQVNINREDIEAAHILPTRSDNSAESVPPSSASASSSTQSRQRAPPTIIVRFKKRDVRDSVLRKRRLLKNSSVSIVEDLTTLNSQTLNRVSKDPKTATAWTWNGKIYVLTKSGDKLPVRPFQIL